MPINQSNTSSSVCQCRLLHTFLFALPSLDGSSWSPKTCLVREKANCCPLCPLAGRSGKTTLEEPSSSITRAEPLSGCGPQCSKDKLFYKVTTSSIPVPSSVPGCFSCLMLTLAIVQEKFTYCASYYNKFSLVDHKLETVIWRPREDRVTTLRWSTPFSHAGRFRIMMRTTHKILLR